MKKIILLLLSTIVLAISACKKDPIIANEEELITTLVYTLTPSTGGTPVEFKFQDLDGEGGNSAVVTEGVLAANTIYSAKIQVLNESVTPTEDIAEEVDAEGEEHQFFFVTNGAFLNIDYVDNDASGNPLGLETTVTTLQAGIADLTISLKHEPKKPNDGTTADAGGETDIEVLFSVEIQ